ncbi:hypothetical protein [Acinetobacter boissieri]|uniref:Uncharacterized protein n=1 Tax=Acinetobacter boissieri TaxID=1219383 RepID=A0A1G6KD14_9GAMM|nr:hypothetical protein [Acinetobacter boissieri]SDC28969.1 hypothetical protein SAMN05421733_11623 [Acinetobacter boissieri]
MINAYRNAIRAHIEQVKARNQRHRLLIWDIQLDEAKDPTLLSFRAYGSRDYVDVVMVASGVSGIWEQLPLKRIALPLLVDIQALKNTYLGG